MWDSVTARKANAYGYPLHGRRPPAPGSHLVAVAGMVAATLIVLTHHFVGDIPGGAFLGWAVGGTVVRAFGLEASSTTAPSN